MKVEDILMAEAIEDTAPNIFETLFDNLGLFRMRVKYTLSIEQTMVASFVCNNNKGMPANHSKNVDSDTINTSEFKAVVATLNSMLISYSVDDLRKLLECDKDIRLHQSIDMCTHGVTKHSMDLVYCDQIVITLVDVVECWASTQQYKLNATKEQRP